MNKYGVYIGRFQPCHNAHILTILEALKHVEQLIVVIGSASCSKSIKNPWTSQERSNMILGALAEYNIPSNRIIFIDALDYLYNDNLWTTAVQTSIANITLDNEDVILFGHDKDKTTFYLRLFPKWRHMDFGSFSNDINATTIRQLYFENNLQKLEQLVPSSVYNYLKAEINSDEYSRLAGEYDHIKEYKNLWSSAPYPPIFVTTDAVVIKSGHILVVRRKANPGKGLIALPGGFLNENEFLIDGAIRELKEETNIGLPKDELKKRIIDTRVFDHPNRSLRGRTITHAYCFNLGIGELPKVKGQDDADKSWWMSLRDVMLNEHKFYEDHFHIIQYFASKF
jgi:bifunctional NMN adenylyltransferase/nudix hydrolase